MDPGPSKRLRYEANNSVNSEDVNSGYNSEDTIAEIQSFASSETDVESETETSSSEEEELLVEPTWCPRTSGLREFNFTKQNEMLFPIPSDNRPIDYFFMLFDNIMLENIVKHTNEYAAELLCSAGVSENSRITRWRDLTVPEFKTFLGLLLHTGTVRLNRLQDYWKQHYLFNLPCFRDHMSRDRFLLILRCLHFSKNAQQPGQPQTPDRLHKVRRLIDDFNNKMTAVYYPQRELSLDEEMVLWRGRLLFRQYIKGKRHKYGIKLYTLTEPHGLILKFIVYCGAVDDLGGKGHAANVVLKLMQGKLGNGHSLYMDNFYNSVPLAKKLLSNRTYCTGTLRASRKFVPKEVKETRLKKSETIERYAEGIMVAKWKDKRVVTYISTEWENDIVDFVNKRQVTVKKPLPIVKYNAFMKGVDRADQMLSYYPCERKTVRWYKKIFIHILQMYLMNALQLYNKHLTDRSKMSMYEFRLSILEALLPMPEHPRRNPYTPLPRSVQHVIAYTDGHSASRPTDKKRKKCRVCYAKGSDKKSIFVCSTCPDKPGLCAVPCFGIFHQNIGI